MFDIIFSLLGIAILAVIIWIGILVIRKLLGHTLRTSSSDSTTVDFRPRLFDSLTVRIALMAILALLMMIPLNFVDQIVKERDERHRTVLRDIARTWGHSQVLAGPVLAVPFTEVVVVEGEVIDEEGRLQTTRNTVRSQHTARFLPSELTIDTTLIDEVRKRGLFQALVYDAQIQLDAQFDPIDVTELSDNIETIHWDKAWVSIGLSDTRAIAKVSRFDWNDIAQTLSPGTKLKSLPSGFHAAVDDINESDELTLSLSFSAKGSDAFQFTPFGTTTRVTMQSTWAHPSFHGNALPDSHEISADGFNAKWEIPHLARNYPQAWYGAQKHDLYEFSAGVTLFEPVSLYSQITRSVKYGLLFIGLTYLTLLIFEITLKRKLHPVQYALVGVALSVFFLVLLALSEHMAFLKAYGLASSLTVFMITVYVAGVLRSVGRGLGIALILSALYAALYSLLQLEDYALLFGTGLLVTIIAVLMLVTRKIQPLCVASEQ